MSYPFSPRISRYCRFARGANLLSALLLTSAVKDSRRVVTMAFRDESPIGFDGTGLLPLVRSGRSPFQDVWDVNLLIREIEDHLASVVDIPAVGKGSNNYGFHCMLSDGRSILARLARGDPNALNYDGFPIEALISEAKFELAAYELLKSQPGILASRLLYHRIPVQHPGPRLLIPQDIMGRRLFVFEKANGEKNVWKELRSDAKVSSQGSIFLASANPECVLQSSLLVQCAQSRAALFRFDLPLPFAAAWLRERLFEQKPASLPIAVAPTRDFCVALFTSKIKATIKNLGDMIGWEDDNHMVGPRAAAAKQSILRLIPHILPPEIDGIYRLVLEHGDFGIHNMSIAVSSDGNPRVTSLYDWETGCVVPAFLSDPLMAVSGVDLILDQYGEPAITRVSDEATLEEKKFYMGWAEEYVKALDDHAPDYRKAIRAGKDARYLWFALRDWRGDDPEGVFGELGAWAEKRMRELGLVCGAICEVICGAIVCSSLDPVRVENRIAM